MMATGWTATGPAVRFEIDVVRAGRYRVGLDYGMPPATEPEQRDGAAVTISATAEGITGEAKGVLPFRRLVQVASPDRVPREEVYEMRWAASDVGELQLPAGRRIIVLQRETAGEAANELNLRELRLTWVGE